MILSVAKTYRTSSDLNRKICAIRVLRCLLGLVTILLAGCADNAAKVISPAGSGPQSLIPSGDNRYGSVSCADIDRTIQALLVEAEIFKRQILRAETKHLADTDTSRNRRNPRMAGGVGAAQFASIPLDLKLNEDQQAYLEALAVRDRSLRRLKLSKRCPNAEGTFISPDLLKPPPLLQPR